MAAVTADMRHMGQEGAAARRVQFDFADVVEIAEEWRDQLDWLARH